VGGYWLERCHRFAIDVKLEGSSMDEKKLEEGGRGGHSLRM
jgi:hypothetical protein